MRQLASLLAAGVPPTRGLAALAKQLPGAERRLARTLLAAVERGAPISAGAAELPGVFRPAQVALLQAAERSGQLEAALVRLATMRETAADWRDKLLTRLLYPVLMLHAGAAVQAAVTWFQGGTGSALRALFGVLLPVYGGVIVLLLVIRYGRRLAGAREFLDTLGWHLPLVGGLWRRLSLASCLHTYEALYLAGVGPVAAIDLAALAADQSVLSGRLARSRALLAEGHGLDEALAAAEILTPVQQSMVATGVESGRLDMMLAKLREQVEHEASVAIDRLGKILPALAYFIVAIWIISLILGLMRGYIQGLTDLMNG